jgi:hypothetical protein
MLDLRRFLRGLRIRPTVYAGSRRRFLARFSQITTFASSLSVFGGFAATTTGA